MPVCWLYVEESEEWQLGFGRSCSKLTRRTCVQNRTNLFFPETKWIALLLCFHEYCTSYIVEIPAQKKFQVVVKKVLKMELMWKTISQPQQPSVPARHSLSALCVFSVCYSSPPQLGGGMCTPCSLMVELKGRSSPLTSLWLCVCVHAYVCVCDVLPPGGQLVSLS